MTMKKEMMIVVTNKDKMRKVIVTKVIHNQTLKRKEPHITTLIKIKMIIMIIKIQAIKLILIKTTLKTIVNAVVVVQKVVKTKKPLLSKSSKIINT
jgi:hypothetical protein